MSATNSPPSPIDGCVRRLPRSRRKRRGASCWNATKRRRTRSPRDTKHKNSCRLTRFGSRFFAVKSLCGKRSSGNLSFRSGVRDGCLFWLASDSPRGGFLMTKYVFVTGGVVSSLGKGIASASLATLLEARGLRVTMLKLDPYINVDPGTMSPYQHGEVFVTQDGAETDLDLGHYERFIRAKMTKRNNFTTGKI